jgi:hypothetical protein
VHVIVRPRVRKLGSPETVYEVTIMVEKASAADRDEPSSDRFRRLPERIRLEDTIAAQET